MSTESPMDALVDTNNTSDSYEGTWFEGFVKQQTKDRGSHIVDELISIVQTLYSADVKFVSSSEKVAYLASLNSSTVIEIKQYILQNWSSTTENAIEMVDDITNDGSVTNWLTVTWDLLFFIIIFVAIVGNLLVLWIVAAHSYMRTIPNIFIVNMSLSDLMMAALNCIFNYIFMRDRNWYFGSTYCHINNFIAIVSVAASVLNLTAMSIDRYKAIVWPLRVRTSKVVVAATIFLIWLGSIIFALPALVLSTTLELKKGQYVCYIKWPDEESGGTSNQDYIYNILILLVTYVLPIILIGICSFHMGVVLWMRQPVGVITPQLQRARRKKQKIVKMLVVLIVIFGVCWFPYHGYFLYVHHFPEVRRNRNIQHYFLAFYWFAMTHSMVNPIVYYLMNPKFRRYYRYVLTLKCLKPSKRDAPAGMFLASAFGLQVAAQLAYGAPAHGCPRHRSSQRGLREERAPLFRSNTVQYEGPGLVMNDRYPMNDRNMLSPQQRQHQSFYEASYRRRMRKKQLTKVQIKESQDPEGENTIDVVDEDDRRRNISVGDSTESGANEVNLHVTTPQIENHENGTQTNAVQIEHTEGLPPGTAEVQTSVNQKDDNVSVSITNPHVLKSARLATPEHDIDDDISQTGSKAKNEPLSILKKEIQSHNLNSSSVPVTPKIKLPDTAKQRPVSANTEGRGRNSRPLISGRHTTFDKLQKQGAMSSGESLYAYMDPSILYSSYATPLSELDVCEDIMELDDEIELDSNHDESATASQNHILRRISNHDPDHESKFTVLRRKSKETFLQVLKPVLKNDGEGKSNHDSRRKSDCNIILNGELVAVGWRRNSATIKICNQALSGDESVF